MQIKEIYVEAKKSKNFQTYTVGILADVQGHTEEEIEGLTRLLQTKCRKSANEQIVIDGPKWILEE